jgi:hypothetical protein
MIGALVLNYSQEQQQLSAKQPLAAGIFFTSSSGFSTGMTWKCS